MGVATKLAESQINYSQKKKKKLHQSTYLLFFLQDSEKTIKGIYLKYDEIGDFWPTNREKKYCEVIF